ATVSLRNGRIIHELPRSADELTGFSCNTVHLTNILWESVFGAKGSRRRGPLRVVTVHMDKNATDELTLARKVIPSLRKGMLCLADRFFPSYKLWRAAATTGADLLWRTRQNARLDVEKRLPDGSYLSRIYASTKDRRKKRNGMVVRVIDYRLKNVADAEPLYRLITTILDSHPAAA